MVGIIGCGTIGSLIVKAIKNGIVECDRVVLYDISVKKAERLKRLLGNKAIIAKNIDGMLSLKPKVIVEAASQQAVKQYIGKILEHNIDFIVLSVGALLDLDVKSSKIHIPSGAIGGLDAISAASLTEITEATLTTRKSPESFGRTDKEEKIIYEGAVEEAVKRYPQNINVAATLALAIKPAKLRVRIISDPKAKRNVHEIEIKWKYGEMTFKFENEAYPENPKTSALAAWSAVSLLKKLVEES